jgi:hypothetical protein
MGERPPPGMRLFLLLLLLAPVARAAVDSLELLTYEVAAGNKSAADPRRLVSLLGIPEQVATPCLAGAPGCTEALIKWAQPYSGGPIAVPVCMERRGRTTPAEFLRCRWAHVRGGCVA